MSYALASAAFGRLFPRSLLLWSVFHLSEGQAGPFPRHLSPTLQAVGGGTGTPDVAFSAYPHFRFDARFLAEGRDDSHFGGRIDFALF